MNHSHCQKARPLLWAGHLGDGGRQGSNTGSYTAKAAPIKNRYPPCLEKGRRPRLAESKRRSGKAAHKNVRALMPPVADFGPRGEQGKTPRALSVAVHRRVYRREPDSSAVSFIRPFSSCRALGRRSREAWICCSASGFRTLLRPRRARSGCASEGRASRIEFGETAGVFIVGGFEKFGGAFLADDG